MTEGDPRKRGGGGKGGRKIGGARGEKYSRKRKARETLFVSLGSTPELKKADRVMLNIGVCFDCEEPNVRYSLVPVF